MHACFVFWILLDSLVALAVSRSLFQRLYVFMLQGIAPSIGIFDFSQRF